MKAQTRALVWFAFLVELYSFFKRLRCDCLSLYPFVDQSRVLPDANLQKLRVDRCRVDELADSAKLGGNVAVVCLQWHGRQHGWTCPQPRMSLETDSHGYVLVFGWMGE